MIFQRIARACAGARRADAADASYGEGARRPRLNFLTEMSSGGAYREAETNK